MLDQREAASVGPRDLKKPGSVDWAWQTLSALKRHWELKELSVRQFEGIVDELRRHRAWEIVPPENPYGSLDVMLQAEIGQGEDQARETVRARMAEAAKNTTGEVLPADGTVHPGNASQITNHTQSARAQQSGVSRYQQQKLDALARLAPEQLERVRRGEVSTHRACVEAGIVKIVPLLEQAKKLYQRMNPEDRLAFLEWANQQGA